MALMIDRQPGEWCDVGQDAAGMTRRDVGAARGRRDRSEPIGQAAR
jgi:hypothetical protein